MSKHIHLQPTGSLWQWRVLDYQETPNVYMTVDTFQTGELAVYTLQNTGVPVVHYSIEAVIILEAEGAKTYEQRKTDLISMLGKAVEFVPFEHTESPLAPVYDVILEEIGAIRFIAPNLVRSHVSIKLHKGAIITP